MLSLLTVRRATLAAVCALLLAGCGDDPYANTGQLDALKSDTMAAWAPEGGVSDSSGWDEQEHHRVFPDFYRASLSRTWEFRDDPDGLATGFDAAVAAATAAGWKPDPSFPDLLADPFFPDGLGEQQHFVGWKCIGTLPAVITVETVSTPLGLLVQLREYGYFTSTVPTCR